MVWFLYNIIIKYVFSIRYFSLDILRKEIKDLSHNFLSLYYLFKILDRVYVGRDTIFIIKH